MSHFLTLCRFALCRVFYCLSFNLWSFYPMAFDHRSFDPMSLNPKKYIIILIIFFYQIRDFFVLFYNLYKEKMFTNEIEVGRKSNLIMFNVISRYILKYQNRICFYYNYTVCKNMFGAKTLNLLQKCDMLYKMKTLTIKY